MFSRGISAAQKRCHSTAGTLPREFHIVDCAIVFEEYDPGDWGVGSGDGFLWDSLFEGSGTIDLFTDNTELEEGELEEINDYTEAWDGTLEQYDDYLQREAGGLENIPNPRVRKLFQKFRGYLVKEN
jgi:hypothetical protein